MQQVTLSDDPRTVRPHASASDITSACGLDDLSTSLVAESTSRTWNIGLHMLTAVAKQRREGWKEAMPRVAQRARHVQERTGTTSAAHDLGLDRLPSLGSTPEGPGSLVPAPSPVRDGDYGGLRCTGTAPPDGGTSTPSPLGSGTVSSTPEPARVVRGTSFGAVRDVYT